jgi:hypothetical protein
MSNESVQKIDSYGNGLSIQYGKPSSPAPEALPAGAKAGVGGVVRVNTHDGIVTTSIESVHRSTDAPDSTDPLDTALDPRFQMRVPRHAIKANTLLTIGGVQAPASSWEESGHLVKDANGYYSIGQPRAQEQPREQQQNTTPMERLSAAAEATITTVVGKLGEANAIAIMRQVAEGKEMPAAGEYASRLGIEPQQFSEMIARTADEYRGQAKRALGMDGETYEEFSRWAMQTDPNTTREAILNAFDRSDYRLAKELAARFQREGASAWSDEELAEIPLGTGGESVAMSKDEKGRPLITIPGYGTMLLRAAIQQQLVSVRRG